MEHIISIPWCFEVSECTQEQWDIIYPYRDLTLGSKISDRAILNYSDDYIGIDYPNNGHTGNLIGKLYKPSELVRLIQGKDKPKFEAGKWYKFAGNGIKGQIGKCTRSTFNMIVFEPWLNEGTSYEDNGTFTKENMTNVMELTDLSEIQEFLPDGHVDKTTTDIYLLCVYGNTTSHYGGKIYKVIDDFIESEPAGSKTHYSGLNSGGFRFEHSTKEDYDAQFKTVKPWTKGTYIVLLEDGAISIGRAKRGDIAVIQIASFEDKKNFGIKLLKDNSTWSCSTKYQKEGVINWFASLSEAIEFAKTLKEPVKSTVIGAQIDSANKDILPPKSEREAVHCPTQEEFDFVISKFNPQNLMNDKWDTYTNRTHLVIQDTNNSYIGCFCSPEYPNNNNFTILTFKEWRSKYYDQFEEEVTIEDLLKEAELKYPIGTKIIPINKDICTDFTDFATVNGKPYTRPYRTSQDLWVSCGKWNCVIYSEGKWAEIFQQEIRYWECLSDYSSQFTKGKIYKSHKSKSANFVHVEKDDRGSTNNGWGKINFKPSTIEAYDEQQLPTTPLASIPKFSSAYMSLIPEPKTGMIVINSDNDCKYIWKGRWEKVEEVEDSQHQDFIKGQWYKIRDSWYAKFETIHNSGKYWRFSNSITSSGVYQGSPSQIKFDEYEGKSLDNLSEIQQYLPIDHPDRVTYITLQGCLSGIPATLSGCIPYDSSIKLKYHQPANVFSDNSVNTLDVESVYEDEIKLLL